MQLAFLPAPVSGWDWHILLWAGKPDILIGDDEVLEAGMIFSLEPSVAQYCGATVIFGYNILVTEGRPGRKSCSKLPQTFS